MTFSSTSALRILSTSCLCLALIAEGSAIGQQIRRKPTRSAPPQLNPQEFEGIFFSDVSKQLQGPPPIPGASAAAPTPSTSPTTTSTSESPSAGSNVWKERISAQSIEDLVKEGKQRLDTFITTPAKFSGGSYKDARREFTLLAILFAAVEKYPEKIRWKSSAALASGRFARVAANTKVATVPTYNEAKLRMDDLATLLKGASLSDNAPPAELTWNEIADRGPSMQILEWAFREHLNQCVASEASFKSRGDEAVMYAELIALIGETMHQPGMVDAEDNEYQSWAKKMIQEATRVVEAVKLSNPQMARDAAGQLDQSCNNCHNTFR